MAAAKTDALSASLEDYLEAIFNLAGDSDFARSRDIAKSLGVSKASVTGALRALKKKRLINYKPYDYVTLTKAGKVAAVKVARKHEILKSFFAESSSRGRTRTATTSQLSSANSVKPTYVTKRARS
jgi:DtxR family Mn-dependent transcriptional regulator